MRLPSRNTEFIIDWFEELDELDLNGKPEHTWKVTCCYEPACKGSRGTFGEPLEPDNPDDVYIKQAVCEETKQVLDHDEFVERFGKDCIECFYEEGRERFIDYLECDGDRLYDEMKDREFDF